MAAMTKITVTAGMVTTRYKFCCFKDENGGGGGGGDMHPAVAPKAPLEI